MPIFTYQLSSVVYLDNKNECYKKIVIINQKPQGSLQSLVRSLHIPKPSPFKTPNNCCPSPYCHQVIMHPNKPNELLCMNEIADLFSFLIANGYTIDTEITKMMMQGTEKIDKLICFISYVT
jgi:hypothetical protein